MVKLPDERAAVPVSVEGIGGGGLADEKVPRPRLEHTLRLKNSPQSAQGAQRKDLLFLKKRTLRALRLI
jgi:hypothetical protein